VLLEILGYFQSAAVPEVAVLATQPDLQRLERVLRGWDQRAPTKNGMDWLWDRLSMRPQGPPES
jgi:hypothetical protein